MVKNSLKRFFHWGPLITIGMCLSNRQYHHTVVTASHQISQRVLYFITNIISFIWSSCLGIIKCVTLTTLYVNSMWWPSSSSVAAILHEAVFLILSSLSAFSYVMATLSGPGFLPLGWQPTVIHFQVVLPWINSSHTQLIFIHRRLKGRNIFNFATFVKDTKRHDRIIVGNVADVSWKWIITVRTWTVWVDVWMIFGTEYISTKLWIIVSIFSFATVCGMEKSCLFHQFPSIFCFGLCSLDNYFEFVNFSRHTSFVVTHLVEIEGSANNSVNYQFLFQGTFTRGKHIWPLFISVSSA